MKKTIALLSLALAVTPAFARGGGGHGFGHASHSTGFASGWKAPAHAGMGWNYEKGVSKPVNGNANMNSLYARTIKSDTWNNSVHTTSPSKHMGVVLKNGHYVFTNE